MRYHLSYEIPNALNGPAFSLHHTFISKVCHAIFDTMCHERKTFQIITPNVTVIVVFLFFKKKKSKIMDGMWKTTEEATMWHY